MNALASYLRHLIVTGLMVLVAKYRLPAEGAPEAAQALALLVAGTLTGVMVKYIPAAAKLLSK
jgi:hypothetical protein